MYTPKEIADMYDHASEVGKEFISEVLESIAEDKAFLYIKTLSGSHAFTSDEVEFIQEVYKLFELLDTYYTKQPKKQ